MFFLESVFVYLICCNYFYLLQGFTFLRIPRSYYGVLTTEELVESAGIPETFAQSIMTNFEEREVVAMDGAVSLDLDKGQISDILDEVAVDCDKDLYDSKRDAILKVVLKSRYKNLHALLRDNVSEETYLGIVRNQILCDVQGEDM